ERVAARANHVVHEHEALLRVGPICLERGRRVGRIGADVADDANDRCPFAARRVAELDPLADRIAIRPESPRHRFVDEHDRRCVARVSRQELSAAPKRNAYRSEVVADHRTPDDLRMLARRGNGLPLDFETTVPIETAQRQMLRGADTLYPRDL